MNTSIRLHHEYIIIYLIYHANKLFKCMWMMITAFSFSPIKQFCGEMVISLPNVFSGDQSLSFRDISLLVLYAVWPLLKFFKNHTVGKHTSHI